MDVKVGDTIKIIHMKDEPGYDGTIGVVDLIDDARPPQVPGNCPASSIRSTTPSVPSYPGSSFMWIILIVSPNLTSI